MGKGIWSRWQAVVAVAIVSGGTLGSCASAPTELQLQQAPLAQASPGQAMADQGMNQPVPASAPAAAAPTNQVTAAGPRSQPQLVRTAELVVTVDGVSQSINRITTLVRQQQGEILQLQEQVPQEGDRRHTAFIQLRVPQAALDGTVKQLAEVGTVQQQSLAAQDVSEQLVDVQARLRNLRRTEEMLLTIMKRSGGVGDVLKVAQELSNVRSSIEQIDAQFKDLQNRVAYSTVNVHLEAAIASTTPGRSTADQLSESWSGATHSLREFTLLLMKLGIWLMVYSPYWVTVGGLVVMLYWRHRRMSISRKGVNP